MRLVLLLTVTFTCASCFRTSPPARNADPCAPITCAVVAAECGEIPDGCGNVIACGECALGLSCGGGGASNRCGPGQCQLKTCSELRAQCGLISDGCAGVLSCGGCPEGLRCAPNHRCPSP